MTIHTLIDDEGSEIARISGQVENAGALIHQLQILINADGDEVEQSIRK